MNDNGGTAVAADWTLSAAGPTPISGAGGVESDVNAGTYALSESTGPAGYTAGSFDCGASVTLALGESKTCTINNNDKTAHLKLVKTVTNDNGGTALPTAFTLSAAGPAPISGAGGAESDVNAGTYTLSETGPAAGTARRVTTVGCRRSRWLWARATCTIVNDDQQGHLKLVKKVVNDNGGTAVESDFTLSAAGPTPISGAGGVSKDVDAGTYTLSETGPNGYSASEWVCKLVEASAKQAVFATEAERAAFATGLAPANTVNVAGGESKECTITNNDIPPSLHLRKIVTNDNGGTKTVADFTLTADGADANDLSGTSPVDSGAGLLADTWALSETSVAGYTASAWSCVGGTQSGSNITVGIGGEATCTITNNDIPPKLIVIKHVISDNGGTKSASDFTMSVTGSSPSPASFQGAESPGTTVAINAGNFSVGESSVYGYTQTSAVGCSGTIAVGETKTCTITNDDQPGKIIVIKKAKPAQGSFAFTTTGAGYNGFTLTGATTNNGNVNSQTLNAGAYTVKEGTQLGWILTGIGGYSNTPYNCTVTGSGGSTGVGDLNTQTATISLKNGDTVTCVFENTGQGVTRTQGFWATHTPLANIAWFGGTAFGHTFPGVAARPASVTRLSAGGPIDDLGKLMGGFWSDISKKSTGAKRSRSTRRGCSSCSSCWRQS